MKWLLRWIIRHTPNEIWYMKKGEIPDYPGHKVWVRVTFWEALGSWLHVKSQDLLR